MVPGLQKNRDVCCTLYVCFVVQWLVYKTKTCSGWLQKCTLWWMDVVAIYYFLTQWVE